MNRYFIAGTDTDAGKTVASCAVVQWLIKQQQQVAVMKPVASGCYWDAGRLVNEDALHLIRQSNVPIDYEGVNPYTFEAAIAPHIAAAEQSEVIDEDRLVAAIERFNTDAIDSLVIEGAGGWMLPLAPNLLMPKIVRRVRAKVILVVGLKLGCLNHALLTLRAIEQDGCECAGWVAVQTGAESMPYQDQNLASLRQLLGTQELAHIPYVLDWMTEDLTRYFHTHD